LRPNVDASQKFSKSIREKSIQYFIDSKFCRLNSGHPVRSGFKNLFLWSDPTWVFISFHYNFDEVIVCYYWQSDIQRSYPLSFLWSLVTNCKYKFKIDDLNVLDKIALVFGYSSAFKRTCHEHTIVTAKDWTWYFF